MKINTGLKKYFPFFFILVLSVGIFGMTNRANAIVYDWCVKSIANCAEPNSPGTIMPSNVPPDSEGHAMDPTKVNYGCPSDHPNYLGCTPDKNTICCGPYSAGPAPKTCLELNGRCVEKTGSCNANETKQDADVSSCASGPDSICCVASAATPAAPKPPTEYKLANPLGTASIPVILGRIIKTFLGIVGAIALAVFVYGGVMWMTARGDAAQVKKGQDALKTAVIGLFIIMFANTLASSYVTFWTAQQGDIAAQEGRTTEAPTVAQGQLGATIESQQGQQAQQAAGQQAAAQAGAQQGVSSPPQACNTPGLTPEQKLTCQSSGTNQQQTTYNTPAPNQGFGGQPTCTPPTANQQYEPQTYAQELNDYNKCLGKTSTIGYKTICNEKIFDSGYGSYNKVSCKPIADCQSGGGNVLSKDCAGLVANLVGAWQTWLGGHCSNPFGNFGNNCGSGNVCCQLP